VAFFSTSQQSHEEWQNELASIQLNTEHLIQQPSPAFLQAIHLARTFKIDFTLDARHSNPRKLLAAIYAPVFLHGRVVGLLGAERHRPLEKADCYFPQWSDDLLTALARLASMSLENAALLSSVEHLINTLVEVSRIGLDRLELYLQEFDLVQLIKRTLKEHLSFTSKHELRLLVHVEPVPIEGNETIRPVLIQADEKRIEEVLTNLISNAIKYSPEGGPITVALHHIDDNVIISVEDQGIGVPPGEQAR